MSDDRLYDINRQVGETLIAVGAIKEMLDSHKQVHEDIKDILNNQQRDIYDLKESRTFARAAIYVVGIVGGAIGGIATLIVKAFAGH